MIRLTIDGLLERLVTYLDVGARERLATQAGLDGHKVRLVKILGLLISLARLESWAKRHHPVANGLLNVMLRRSPLRQLCLSKSQMAAVVRTTVARNGVGYGFTFSDLTQRLMPAIVLDAYPDRAVDPDRAISIVQSMIPTEPFREARDK